MRSLLSLLFIGLISSVNAQTMGDQSLAQLKESPAGSKILWFVDAVNSNQVIKDEVLTQKFDEKLIDQVGVADLGSTINEIWNEDGALTIYSAKRQKVNEYMVKLKGKKSGSWLDMKFYFRDVDPYKITGFTLDSAPAGIEAKKPIYPLKN